MESKVEVKGLSGLSKSFRAAVESIGKEGDMLFVGSPFTCLPFAEFLSYGIRDFPLKPFFMPSSEASKIREIVKDEGYGYQLGKLKAGTDYRIVTLLGGLAIPKYGVPPKVLKEAIDSLPGKKDKVAVCFQGSLRSPEWTNTFQFKYLIDTDLTVAME
ncbi:MAG: DUF2124 family protein [Candidatus Methanosuratincola sp.]